jgi:hypothetical protein
MVESTSHALINTSFLIIEEIKVGNMSPTHVNIALKPARSVTKVKYAPFLF